MNVFIWGVGTLSVVSVVGGMLNLLRLTLKIAKRERRVGHVVDLQRRAA